MNARQTLQAGSIDRAVDALRKMPARLSSPELQHLLKKLAPINERIEELRQQQFNLTKAPGMASMSIDIERRRLRLLHLIPIARRAKPHFRDEPAVLRTLRVPPVRATAIAHADAALAMAKALKPHAKYCHGEGFRTGFITDMTIAAKQLRTNANKTDAARRQLTLVTRELQSAILEGRRVMGVVDAEVNAMGVHPTFGTRLADTVHEPRDLESFRGDWERAMKLGKRVGRPPRRRRARPAQSELPAD